MPVIKTVGIVSKPNSPAAGALVSKLIEWLSQRGIEYQSFVSVNALLVKGTQETAEALAARSDVARVEGNPQVKNSFPQPGPAVESPLAEGPETVEPGVTYIHAPDVWAEGFTR